MVEFNLREKREKLRKVMVCSLVESGILNFGKAESIMDKCIEQIEKQDKEFIKLLKEELPDELYKQIGMQGLDRSWKQPDGRETYWELINKIIDKLAGEKLI